MDSLYFIGRAQFHQLATHISLYREESSGGYQHLGRQSVTEAGMKADKLKYWNVPMMSSYLGKTVPLDVHGGHVLVDEEKVMSMATSYGMLRYAYLAAAVRAKEGGRWRYDFISMNLSLGLGVASGSALLYFGRRRFAWMRRHPVGSVVGGLFCCLFTTIVARKSVKGLGIGIVHAQKSHKKALERLGCLDCLDDVNLYTSNQMEETRAQTIPRQPGMPPPPEEYVRQFERGKELQCKLLETDMAEVRIIRKRVGDHFCEVHRGLREDPIHFQEGHGLLLLISDRDRAAERVRSAAAAEAATSTS